MYVPARMPSETRSRASQSLTRTGAGSCSKDQHCPDPNERLSRKTVLRSGSRGSWGFFGRNSSPATVFPGCNQVRPRYSRRQRLLKNAARQTRRLPSECQKRSASEGSLAARLGGNDCADRPCHNEVVTSCFILLLRQDCPGFGRRHRELNQALQRHKPDGKNGG